LGSLPVEFHVGVFPNLELPPGPFAFVHLDCDLFQSYADGLAYFWPRMSQGAYLVMDDYGVWSCAGATRAADDYFKALDLEAAPRMQKP
jgi:O-methyltransferase